MSLRSSHTQVPNLLCDFVIPLLGHAEAECLLYIIRRTVGFAAPGGGRKRRDRISLSQFEHGIQTGPYVLDLGTGLSRTAVLRGLAGLVDKGLVEVSPYCTRCRWNENDDEQLEDPPPGRCPRCRRSLDKRYGLAPLSSRRLIEFLNTHDPKNRRFAFDRETMRFFIVAADDAPAPPPASAEEIERDYAAMLWYPELVAALIAQMEASGARVGAEQRVRHFYRPVIEMQETCAEHPPVVKKALEETERRGIVAQARQGQTKAGNTWTKRNWEWHRYARAICQRELADRRRRPARATEARDAVADLLTRAAQLNKAGDVEAARALLSEILSHSERLASHFAGSVDLADAHLRLAFKRGSTDYRTVRQLISATDYYPEWHWPPGL